MLILDRQGWAEKCNDLSSSALERAQLCWIYMASFAIYTKTKRMIWSFIYFAAEILTQWSPWHQQDTPSMLWAFQLPRAGTRGMITNRSGSIIHSNVHSSWVIDGRFWTVVRRLSYPNRSRILYPKGWQLTLCLMFLLLWLVLNRLAGGVKCTRAWPWWPFVAQGMRFLSTDRDRLSYCFSTSCRGRPCRKMEPPHN